MTFGYSRDDVGKFLPSYLSAGILQHDPFEVSCIVVWCVISGIENFALLCVKITHPHDSIQTS